MSRRPAGEAGYLIEAMDAVEQLSNDQEGPSLTEHRHCIGDRAVSATDGVLGQNLEALGRRAGLRGVLHCADSSRLSNTTQSWSSPNGNSSVTICGMDVFAALADPVRRSILVQLSVGPTRVVDLVVDQPISRPAISRHLRVLSEAGLTTGRDVGRERHYRLVAEPLRGVRDFLDALDPSAIVTTPIPESVLDALETEVRRTVRERRSSAIASGHQAAAATERTA